MIAHTLMVLATSPETLRYPNHCEALSNATALRGQRRERTSHCPSQLERVQEEEASTGVKIFKSHRLKDSHLGSGRDVSPHGSHLAHKRELATRRMPEVLCDTFRDLKALLSRLHRTLRWTKDSSRAQMCRPPYANSSALGG